jgi:hypothetical protein
MVSLRIARAITGLDTWTAAFSALGDGRRHMSVANETVREPIDAPVTSSSISTSTPASTRTRSPPQNQRLDRPGRRTRPRRRTPARVLHAIELI